MSKTTPPRCGIHTFVTIDKCGCTMGYNGESEPARPSEDSVRVQRLVSRLRDIVKTMRTNATALKSGKGYSHPELQSERNASAHSMEFWALRIEEELAANVRVSDSPGQD